MHFLTRCERFDTPNCELRLPLNPPNTQGSEKSQSIRNSEIDVNILFKSQSPNLQSWGTFTFQVGLDLSVNLPLLHCVLFHPRGFFGRNISGPKCEIVS